MTEVARRRWVWEFDRHGFLKPAVGFFSLGVWIELFGFHFAVGREKVVRLERR